MERIRILFTMLASIVLSVVVFFSYMDVDSVNAQSNNSTNPKTAS